MAHRLLQDLEQAHAALIEQTNADEAYRRVFRVISEAMSAGMDGFGDEELTRSPSPEEWSMAEVVEHVAEHDWKYVELIGQGLDHYVDHGLEHVMQLWRLRGQARE